MDFEPNKLNVCNLKRTILLACITKQTTILLACIIKHSWGSKLLDLHNGEHIKNFFEDSLKLRITLSEITSVILAWQIFELFSTLTGFSSISIWSCIIETTYISLNFLAQLRRIKKYLDLSLALGLLTCLNFVFISNAEVLKYIWQMLWNYDSISREQFSMC